METKEGDIVLAPFHYMESEEKKHRPALVWDINPLCVTLVFISSQHAVGGYKTEIGLRLDEARSIGLAKPSRICFAKRDRCMPWDIKRVIGHISSLPKRKLQECAEAAEEAGLINL